MKRFSLTFVGTIITLLDSVSAQIPAGAFNASVSYPDCCPNGIYTGELADVCGGVNTDDGNGQCYNGFEIQCNLWIANGGFYTSSYGQPGDDPIDKCFELCAANTPLFSGYLTSYFDECFCWTELSSTNNKIYSPWQTSPAFSSVHTRRKALSLAVLLIWEPT
jgi:hypothetical protein